MSRSKVHAGAAGPTQSAQMAVHVRSPALARCAARRHAAGIFHRRQNQNHRLPSLSKPFGLTPTIRSLAYSFGRRKVRTRLVIH